ncbi:MAG: SLC13 family permease [Thermoplasmata archaeon]
MLVALIIFLFTYVLISLRRFKLLNFERPATALFGAMLMIIFGIITPAEAFNSIDLNIIFLLLGMMIIVSSIGSTGFFTYISVQIVRHSKTGLQFLIYIMVITAGLSALFLNDAVVLFLTPIIIESTRMIKVNPVPYLLSEIFAANIGSVATLIGNPQNVYIAIHSSLSFGGWLMVLGPVAIISLIVAIIIIYAIYKKDINVPIKSMEEKKELENKSFLLFAMAVIIATLIAFLISRQIAIIALVSGSILLFVSPLFKNSSSKMILKNVDWSIIVFFIGLFILLEGVEVSGVLGMIINYFNSINLSMTNMGSLVTITAILSNLVSNVPAVLLIAQFIPYSSSHLWLALAMSSTLAGNLTIIGAAANIIVLEIASSMGVDVNWKEFSKAGIPVSIATLLIGVVVLTVI